MKRDLVLSFAIVFQLVVTVFQLLLPMLGLASEEFASQLRVLVTLATFLPAIWIVFLRGWLNLVIPFVIYVIVLIFNILLFPASEEFIKSSDVKALVPISILAIIIFASIKRFEAFQKMLLWISRVCVFISLLFVYAARNLPQTGEVFSYSMSFGYSMLLPALFLFMQQYVWDKAGSIALFVAILLVGSRGPVIVMVLFYCYYLVFVLKIKIRLLLPTFAVMAIGLVILMNSSGSEFLESSRTLKMIQGDELISHDSGRDDLQRVVKLKIEERPITGWGLGSDRKFVGFYCHNIFLEIFCHFGVFVGGLLFLSLLLYLLKMYFRPKLLTKAGGREFFVLMFLFGFIPMFVSGSYLTNFRFALYMGYLVWIYKNTNIKQVLLQSGRGKC